MQNNIHPLVSVIIPTYNGGPFVGEAVQSVLDQSYSRLELIVADDSSSDDTVEIVSRFEDPRVRVILHSQQRGADVARKTALEASSGDIIAFLDQDDRFHPEKIDAHVQFLACHGDVGFSYNPHFVLSHPSNTVRGLWRPPHSLTLHEFVEGFPIPPSVWVLRRQWAEREELWGADIALHGRETVICGRLLLAGCTFGEVERTLNYRRVYESRPVGDIAAKYAAERRCQELIWSDPRCPKGVRDVWGTAVMKKNLSWAYVALSQDDVALGWRLLRQAIELDSGLVEGNPCPLVTFLLHCTTVKGTEDHEAALRALARRLPPELQGLSGQIEWAISEGYFLRGGRAIIWGQVMEGYSHLASGMHLGGDGEDLFIPALTSELLSYEREFGVGAGAAALSVLTRCLGELGARQISRRIEESYHLNRGFERYSNGHRLNAIGEMLQAVLVNPTCLANPGVRAVLLRSLAGVRHPDLKGAHRS